MNTYKKYCPNVFVAQCTEKHERGKIIILETKYGKEIENEVHNFLHKTKDGLFLHSITRVDGFNSQERAKNKAERLNGYAENAEKRSTAYYEASHEGRDFLSLGEPIKIGHHSERRHRKLIERNWNRMGKSVAEGDKVKEYERRAEYWEARSNKIDLSMPDCLGFFEFELEKAETTHKFLLENPGKRPHSMSLQYSNKKVKELKEKIDTAIILWGDEEEVAFIRKEKEETKKAKITKKKGFDALKEQYGGFFFFGSDTVDFKAKYNNLVSEGYLEDGEKVCHIVAGFYTPVKNKAFIINGL
ncbi:MAG: hypothetical protein ACJARG_000049 [Arcticibacterium sp.]|jgi:hypothetical protein